MSDLTKILKTDPSLTEEMTYQEFSCGKRGFDDSSLETAYQAYQEYLQKQKGNIKPKGLAEFLEEPTLTRKITNDEFSSIQNSGSTARKVYKRKQGIEKR